MAGLDVAANPKEYRFYVAGSVEDQMSFLLHYCEAHPMAHYMDAVLQLVNTMPKQADEKQQ
jgi:hypothetical protein